jgi:hypothetical protein
MLFKDVPFLAKILLARSYLVLGQGCRFFLNSPGMDVVPHVIVID